MLNNDAITMYGNASFLNTPLMVPTMKNPNSNNENTSETNMRKAISLSNI